MLDLLISLGSVDYRVRGEEGEHVSLDCSWHAFQRLRCCAVAVLDFERLVGHC